MDEMYEDELRRRLATLSQRERQVLMLVCNGTSYKEIAKILFIAEPTVRAVMGRVYVKLGLDQLERSKRPAVLHQLYCPQLREEELPEPPAEPVHEEPVPEKVIGMVEEDERAIVPYVKDEIVYIPPTDPPPPPPRRRWWLLILGLIAGFLLATLGFIFYTRFINPQQPQASPEATQSIALDTEVSVVPPREVTVIVSSTPEPYMPTSSPVVQERVVIVTATPLPATPIQTATSKPVNEILFSDNFDEGLSSAWSVNSGNPVVVNGMLTTDQDTWLSVGDDSWTNYTVEFDSTGADCWFSWSWHVLGVRSNGMDNMVAFKYARCENEWDIVNAGKWSTVPNSHYSEGAFGDMRIGITAKGDFFAVNVNGERISSFVNSNNPQGYVAIKLGRNLMVDNFKVTAIQE